MLGLPALSFTPLTPFHATRTHPTLQSLHCVQATTTLSIFFLFSPLPSVSCFHFRYGYCYSCSRQGSTTFQLFIIVVILQFLPTLKTFPPVQRPHAFPHCNKNSVSLETRPIHILLAYCPMSVKAAFISPCAN